MATYIGRGGVVREATADAQSYSVLRHATHCYVGVDGTVRDCFSWADDLQSVQVIIDRLLVMEPTSDGTGWVGSPYTLAEAQKFGTVDIATNSIRVQSTTAGKGLEVDGNVALKCRDGHCIRLNEVISEASALSLTLGYAMGVRGSSSWSNDWGGVRLYNSYVNNYASGTQTVNAKDAGSDYILILAGLVSGSYAYTQMSFNSCQLNGKTYPIEVVNLLK